MPDRRTRLGDKSGDSFGIDLDVIGIQPIAAVTFDDRRRAEHPPQPHDVPLQRLARRRRPPLRPQRLLQHVHRHPLTNPRRERGEHRPLRPRQPHDSVAVDQFDRAEDPNLHVEGP